MELESIVAEPIGELPGCHQEQAEEQDDPLPGKLGILEAGGRQIGVQGEEVGPPSPEELVFIAGIIEQFIADILDVKQVGPRLFQECKLRVEQTFNAPLGGNRGEAAD